MFCPRRKYEKMREYCMYFPFFILHDWGKRSVEARSSHCVVLPYVRRSKRSLHLGQVMAILPLCRGTRTVWRQRGQMK